MSIFKGTMAPEIELTFVLAATSVSTLSITIQLKKFSICDCFVRLWKEEEVIRRKIALLILKRKSQQHSNNQVVFILTLKNRYTGQKMHKMGITL